MMDENERRAYEGYLAYLGQEMDILDTAKAEGRAEVRAEVRAEGQDEKAVEIARNLLNENIPVHLVEKVTGLSLDVIKKLVSELGL